MRYEHLLEVIAPCGLYCGKCLAYPDSPISRLSRQLKEELGGFASIAARFASMDPAFNGFPEFERILDRFARGGCSGCRTGECLFAHCLVKECVRERSVDFCFQCTEFPCDRTNFPPNLRERWEQANRLMGEIGVPAFFESVRGKPRY
jgi:hypothetical protein